MRMRRRLYSSWPHTLFLLWIRFLIKDWHKMSINNGSILFLFPSICLFLSPHYLYQSSNSTWHLNISKQPLATISWAQLIFWLMISLNKATLYSIKSFDSHFWMLNSSCRQKVTHTTLQQTRSLMLMLSPWMTIWNWYHRALKQKVLILTNCSFSLSSLIMN